MTNTSDLGAHDAPRPTLVSRIFRLVLLFAVGLAAVFALGVVVGASGAAMEKGYLTLKTAGVIGGALLACGLLAYLLYRLKPDFRTGEPVGKKTRRANWALIASGVLGGIIGLVLGFTEFETGQSGVFSNGPLPLGSALFVVAAYVLLLPVASYYWQQNADEFEQDASAKGALAGMYAFGFITPTWWILQRAGLVPEQDPMIVYVIVISVWGIVWQLRRAD